MTPKQWQDVKSLFGDAIQQPAAVRMALAHERCGDDPEVLRELQAMLAEHHDATAVAIDETTRPGIGGFSAPLELPTFAGLEVIEEVAPGTGGMGHVYRARELSLDRIVAVKTIKEHLRSTEGRALFLSEARAAAQLDHPNILRIHRFSPEHDPPFCVMQYVDGRTLDKACEGRSLRFIAEVIAKTARALDYAHRHGIVHRDIKPANILVDFDGEPHIADFGLAGYFDRSTSVLAPDAMGISGTPSFIAPEVFTGMPAKPRADIYALGVTCYQLFTRRLPFTGTTLADIRQAVTTTDPPLLLEINPSIPEPLQRICLKAMERDIEARYESGRQMADDLTRFLDGREVSARPTCYQVQLQGRIANHLTDVRLWHEQHLIDTREMDRLARPYQAILDAVSPWHELSQRFPWETVVLRLGGWLVLLSSVLWPTFYWDRLSGAQRVLAIAFPTLAINLVGWILYLRQSRVTALIYLLTGALLVPLFVAVASAELHLLTFQQDRSRELFNDLTNHSTFRPTNLQTTAGAAAFVAYCLPLLLLTRARILAVWLCAGIYILHAGLLLLAGAREWIEYHHVTRVILFALPLAAAFWPAARLLRRSARAKGWAPVVYAFFPVPLVALLDLLARYGATEWFDASDQLDNELINQWLMLNGVCYVALAWAGRAARSSSNRFWGDFFTAMIAIHLIWPTNYLFEKGQPLFALGGNPFRIYELLLLLFSITLTVVGTRLRQNILAFPGLVGLAMFVLRVTDRHFGDYLAWPLALAILGALAMPAALISLTLRNRRRQDRQT